MSSAVIIATSYDTPCNYTFAWAMKLKDGLLKQGHSCVLIPGEGICAAGATLSEAIDRSDFVVFLGHGTANELTRLPSRGAISSLALIESQTAHLFGGRPVYAGCCSSLGNPGVGLGSAYANMYATGSYVGYEQKFIFEYENESYFGEVVIASIVEFVNGITAKTVVQNLQQEWINLKNRFYSGNLKNNRNASQAGWNADWNSKYVGSK